jgi:hypothetical protein
MGSDNGPEGKRTTAGSGLLGLLLTIFKGLGLVVVLVAVAVGTVAKVKPTLFFQIPKVGFIAWAITGGAMPPYSLPDVYSGDNHNTWLKVIPTQSCPASPTTGCCIVLRHVFLSEPYQCTRTTMSF